MNSILYLVLIFVGCIPYFTVLQDFVTFVILPTKHFYLYSSRKFDIKIIWMRWVWMCVWLSVSQNRNVRTFYSYQRFEISTLLKSCVIEALCQSYQIAMNMMS